MRVISSRTSWAACTVLKWRSPSPQICSPSGASQSSGTSMPVHSRSGCSTPRSEPSTVQSPIHISGSTGGPPVLSLDELLLELSSAMPLLELVDATSVVLELDDDDPE